MFAKMWLTLLSWLRIKYSVYKKTIWWFLFWLALGIVLAFISITIGSLGMDDINHNLVDGNILNMASNYAGIGSFIWQRLLSLALPVLLVFGFALCGKFTACIVYPLILMHGYWLCMSFWWTWLYYSFNAFFLLAFYLFWLLLVTAVLFAGVLWALGTAQLWRDSHFHCPGIGWQIVRGAAIIGGVAVIMGLLEYLIFWLILGRIVYKPV